ncbi:MAG: shikimate kinase [Geminicoccaceae bacterium]
MEESTHQDRQTAGGEIGRVLDRTVVLVGMMGAGKTSVGRRLASVLGWRFQDADWAIEQAAGTSIANIFQEIGEAAFRQSERQVIVRLLGDDKRQVLALGGGSFVAEETRALIREKAVSVWLDAGLDVLVRRTGRRDDRPLLRTGDPEEILGRLLLERRPTYQQADIVVDSGGGSLRDVVDHVVAGLRGYVDRSGIDRSDNTDHG